MKLKDNIVIIVKVLVNQFSKIFTNIFLLKLGHDKLSIYTFDAQLLIYFINFNKHLNLEFTYHLKFGVSGN